MPQIITDTVVTSQPITCSQFQFWNKLDRFHPFLFGKSPSYGTGRKHTPLLTGCKLRRAVCTKCKSGIITAFIIVQGTTKERGSSVRSSFITGTLVWSAQCKVFKSRFCRNGNREITCTHKSIVILRMVYFLSNHQVYIMNFTEQIAIGQRICQSVRLFMCFSTLSRRHIIHSRSRRCAG